MLRRTAMTRSPFKKPHKLHAEPVVTTNDATHFQCANCGCQELKAAVQTWAWGKRSGQKRVLRCSGCKRIVHHSDHEPGAFDSTLEWRVYEYLMESQKRGEIWDLERQTEIVIPYLNASGTWHSDFTFSEPGRSVCVDAKGKVTNETKILRRLWKDYGTGVLRLVRAGRNRDLVWLPDIEGKAI